MKGGEKEEMPADPFGGTADRGEKDKGWGNSPADVGGDVDDWGRVEEAYLYSEESYLLRGGLFTVQNEVGLGRKEEVYHQAFKIWLEEQKIPFMSKAPHPVRLGGEIAHVLYPDFVLWDKITLELKALPFNLEGGYSAQLFNYLKLRGDQLGLLINLGLDVVKGDRIIYQSRSPECQVDFSEWDDCAPQCGEKVKQVFRRMYLEHTTGFGTEVIEKLLWKSIQFEQIAVQNKPSSQANFHGHALQEDSLDCLVFNHEVVVCVTALYHSNLFNAHRVQSFMKSLNLPFGLAVNFGKTKLEIKALSDPHSH